MTILNDVKQIEKIDKSNMADLISDLPDQILKAYQLSQKLKLPKDYQNIKNIVVCGMGGSAISGDLVKTMVNNQFSLPFIVNRDWSIPSYVDKNSLVFLVSYSGNTQETLSCAKDTIKNKAKIIIITSGGKLKKFAQEKKLPFFTFNYQGPPRTSIGYLFMPILITLERLKLVNLNTWNIPSSIKKLKNFNQLFYIQTPVEKNIAKHLAYFIFDHLPIVIAPEDLSGIARRFKTQLAENSKSFSFFETAPEIFHNSTESEIPWRLKDEVVFLILENFKKQAKLKKSLTAFEKLLDRKNIRWEGIPCFGNNIFVQTLSLILVGDWTSFYLAILNKVDPTPNKSIQWLKKQINK